LALNARTKLAIIQNMVIGIPVIIGISLFNGLATDASALVHTLGSAVIGFTISFLMLYASLRWLKVRSKYDARSSAD